MLKTRKRYSGLNIANLKQSKMKTIFKKMEDLANTPSDQCEITQEILDRRDCPIDIGMFPNQMGINLCSVDSVSWTRQDDGQLVNIVINFLPEKK